MKSLFALLLGMIATSVFAADFALVKNTTNANCSQYVNFTCPSNTYAGTGMTGGLTKVQADLLYPPMARTITINGQPGSLSSNLEWTVSGGSADTNGLWNRTEGTNWVTGLGYGTGNLSKAVADLSYAGIGVTNNPTTTNGLWNRTEGTNWVATQYLLLAVGVTNSGCTINGVPITNGAVITISGTGAVSAADCTNIVVALAAPISVTIPAASNAALAGVAASYLPLDGSQNMTGKLYAPSASVTNGVVLGTDSEWAGTSLDIVRGVVWLRTGVTLLVDTISGYSGTPVGFDNGILTNLSAVWSTKLYEGTTDISAKYAPIAVTIPAASNAALAGVAASYVPYNGATGPVNLGGQPITNVSSLTTTNILLRRQSIVVDAESIGMEAVDYPISGHTNSAFLGYGALSTGVGGTLNSAVGYNATAAGSGSYLSLFGAYSGFWLQGNSNTCIGYKSGYCAAPTAARNVTTLGAGVSSHGNDTVAIGRPNETTYIDGALVVSNGFTVSAITASDIANALKFPRGDGTYQSISAGGGDAYLTNSQTFTASNTFSGTFRATVDGIVSNANLLAGLTGTQWTNGLEQAAHASDTYLPLSAGSGKPLTGNLYCGSNELYHVKNIRLNDPDTEAPKGVGAGIQWGSSGTYIGGNSYVSHPEGRFVDVGFQGTPYYTFTETYLDLLTHNITNAATVDATTFREGGTSLAAKYAPISVTIPAASNAALAGVTALAYTTYPAVSNIVTSYGYGTGTTSKAYVDNQDVATSNGVVAWVTAQGYGTGTGISAGTATNIFSAMSELTYWTTNTITITNTLDFAITGLAANRVMLDDVRMFLNTTNAAPISKRAKLELFRNSTRRDGAMVYLDTNQLYYSILTTVAGVAGESTNVVADASGTVVNDLYYKADPTGGTSDYQRVSSASATVITWGCTNLFSMPTNSLISHVNQFGGFPYYDATGASSMWFRLTFPAGYTGTLSTVLNYGR